VDDHNFSHITKLREAKKKKKHRQLQTLDWLSRASGKEPGQTRGVSHCGLAIYIKKYLKAKEELWKLKYFTMQI
jgi:hypothetical protein